MRRIVFVLLVGSVLPVLAVGPDQRPAGATRTAIVDHCSVRPLTRDGEAQVPAQEAGVIMGFKVREMDQVTKGAPLATIDDALAQSQLESAKSEFNAAYEKAESKIDEEVATAAWKAADFAHQSAKAANDSAKTGVKGAFSATELKRLEYEAEHMRLAIDQAKSQQKVNRHTRDAKKAEVKSAQEQVNRREVRAPIDGVVHRIVPHLGEWVKAGDPILRIVHMDKLNVDGYVEIEKYSPDEVQNRPVTVKVKLAGGKEVAFDANIVAVDLEVEGGREYKVTAEVNNRKEKNEWLLRPGLIAKMVIALP